MWRTVFTLMICIGLLSTFMYIATAIHNGSIVPFDTAIIDFVQGVEAPWLTSALTSFTEVGSATIVAPLALLLFTILYFGLRARPQAWLLLIVVAGTPLFNTLLKLYFKRERPDLYRLIEVDGFSFPSGHAMISFSLYTIIAFIAWGFIKTTVGRTLLVLFTMIMILTISISRVYLGVHYPSDIVGGFTVSALWLTITITLYTYWVEKRKPLRV